jgi:hypothetical protein
MEQIVVELSAFTRRSGSVAVGHVRAGLSRGLEPGELVLVHDPADGADFTAAVADIDFELADTVYRLELGTRITAAETVEWLAPTPAEAPAGHVSARRLAELLGELRRRERALEEFLGAQRG